MRTSERRVRKQKKQRNRSLRNFISGVLTVILTIVVSFGIGSFYANAQESDEAPAEIKYYKSIQIEKGDSLWSIAKVYMNDDYESVYDYMAELVQINQLDDEEIDYLMEGDYLTVAYYAAETTE